MLDSGKYQVPFLAKIIHELKTPIHGISGIASVLEGHWDMLDNDTRRKCINDICKASEKLIKLIETFLQLPRFDAQEISLGTQETDLVDLIKTSIDNSTYLLQGKNLEIDFKFDHTKKHLADIDSFWFKQVITNLLDNAIHYSTNNGTILVKLNKVVDMAGNQYYSIVVQDEGKGFPRDKIKNIFSEFTYVPKEANQAKNLGLGLAICKEIVESHGGTIHAQNNELKGARIEFSIPIEEKYNQ